MIRQLPLGLHENYRGIKMAPPTIPPNANALEHRKADVIVDSCSFETVKYFITQTIIFIEKLFRKKIPSRREL